MIVFVPLAPADLRDWATSGRRSGGPGFAATRAFLTAFGLASADDEDADLTLAEIAGIAGLLAHGVRLVAVCDADAVPGEPADLGAVMVAEASWSRVSSLFAEAPEDAVRAAEVRAALAGSDLTTAWDVPDVGALVSETSMLWHAPGEWTVV